MDGDTILGIGGLAAGAVSCITAIGALVYAHKANTKSNKSNTLATEANDLATEANDLAKGSNTIALDARKIALHAEARETETHDVYWEGDWQQPGIYVLTKRGNDGANDVKATVSTRGGSSEPVTAECVRDDGDTLVFEFPTVRAEFEHEDAQRSRMRHISRNTPGGFVQPPLRLWFVDEHITWTTNLGTPKRHDETDKRTNLDAFYT